MYLKPKKSGEGHPLFPVVCEEMDEIVVNRRVDEYYMHRALSLALRGTGRTSPNPMVGCVLVRDGRVLGEGWHRRCGEDHAEVAALKDAEGRGETARGAEVYVTLEPCCHFGRTPPCAQRLVREGVSRVVAGTADPNPKVNAGGLTALREAGVEVTAPCLEKEARWLNRGFIRVQTLGRPWVTLKAASGLDGRMALTDGDSRWITGPEARQWAHRMRASHDAILVGVGTVLKDDPELTVRHTEGQSPLRVILDSHLRTPTSAKVLRGGCLVLTISQEAERAQALQDAGARVVSLPSRGGRVDLEAALSFLAREGVLMLMVEGGPRVLTALMERHLADSLSLFVAPRVLGEGIGMGEGFSPASVADSLNLRDITSRPVGDNLLLEGRFSCSPDL